MANKKDNSLNELRAIKNDRFDYGMVTNAIYTYLENYHKKGFVNYYDIFKINPKFNAQQIVNLFITRKYEMAFSPEVANSLPQNMVPYFQTICKFYREFKYLVSHPERRKEYDMMLNRHLGYNSNKNTENKPNKIDRRRDNAIANRIPNGEIITENPKEKFDKEQLRKVVFQNFGNYLLPTIAKYGKEFTIKAVSNYLMTGNISSFTRDLGTRDKIAKLPINGIIFLIKKAYQENDVNAVASMIVYDTINYNCNMIENATLRTYQKYGYEQSKGALEALLKDGKTTNFTNAYGDRANLNHSYIYYTTLPFLMAYQLKIGNKDLSKVNKDVIIDEYMKSLEEKMVDRKGMRK